MPKKERLPKFLYPDSLAYWSNPIPIRIISAPENEIREKDV
ncbi:hypothetical protein HMPREF1990_02192 [Porphyromonas gingivalis W4087]|uniref:Uncharacterized protein n=1 Tax=Porphyromonas gingivalis F0570 TaxID=1227271 RepID=A0A0E2M7K3_PORGN|nr:hypothetical protein HMPREF1555_00400 [Porphyromonas gingivalis F0570]ERJ69477.1 hypothetical protein HMPREF1554_00579 [Porphyromonas gingivalis F0569]ERJ70087.1 hypothetical protein HMPREF1553_00430 [Porphyromonas gingivalis F0568]ERJ85629.1 hypothetical protein HMPREF1990_02192 [Porphyromonas gingivalis W4087]